MKGKKVIFMDAKAILAKWAAQEWTERHKELEEAIKEEMEEQKKEEEKKAKKYKVKN